jgi:hypothetical protein
MGIKNITCLTGHGFLVPCPKEVMRWILESAPGIKIF